MEIYPNVHEIKSVFGNRHIQQYLFVGETVVLLDAGVAGTPQSTLFPYLEKIGLSPQRISLVIGTHADVDHHGGMPLIKDASPSTLLACHEFDRQLIEDPDRLYESRYNFLAKEHLLGFGREGMIHCPTASKIDVVLAAGETIQLAPDWRLQVWHVPGHSEGHLAIYDQKHRAAFTSDAAQANGYPTIDGRLAFGPTYYEVEAYLATIHFLEGQPIEHMFTGHWPAAHGAAVGRFLEGSRKFVLTAHELIREHLFRHHRGVTLKQLIHQLSGELGSWSEDTAEFLQFAVYGHLLRLEQQGAVRRSRTVPVEYFPSDTIDSAGKVK